MTIDWAQAYAWLDRWQQELAGTGRGSPEAAARVLAARAAALALPASAAAVAAVAATPAGTLTLLVFALAGERYAVDAAHVVEVIAPRGLTPLPLVPDFLPGIVYHQGRVVPVFDLRRLMGLAGPPWKPREPVVVTETDGKVFALRADAVAGTRHLAPGELAPLPAAAAPDRGPWFSGLAGDRILVVDLPALAADPRLTLNDDGTRARGG